MGFLPDKGEVMDAPAVVSPSTLANVEALFSELAAIYGARFADMWRNTDVAHVKAVWAGALGGLKVGEVRQGLIGCRKKPWPPTLPEFLLLCRAEPDDESLFAEAQLQAWHRRNGRDVWADPVLFWAAYAFGFYELKMASWQMAKTRWMRIVAQKRECREALPPVPRRAMAIADAGSTVSDKASARRHLARLKGFLKTGSTGEADEKGRGCDQGEWQA